MKKFYFLLLIPLLVPLKSLATSGACSYHNGVNCNLQYNGYAECNDGWISSTLYSQADECKTKCAAPVALCDESQLAALNSKLGGAYSGVNALMGNGQIAGSAAAAAASNVAEAQYGPLISECESEIALYKAELNDYNQCLLSSETSALNDVCSNDFGVESHFDTTLNKCICNAGYMNGPSSAQCIMNGVYCLAYQNGRYNESDRKCECASGYVMSNNVCVTYSDNCKSVYGDNVYGDANYCYCDTGYEWNDNKTACIQKIIITPSPVVDPTIITPITISTSTHIITSGTPKIVKTKKRYASFSSICNIRGGANLKAPVIGLTSKKVNYDITDLSNKNWVKIKFGEKEGWVYKGLAKIN